METDNSYNEELKQLEEQLLQPEFRSSSHDVAYLLADEFTEFGSSGRIFDKSHIVEALQSESAEQLSLMDFQTRALAPGVILATYRAARYNEVTGQTTYSLRSSIWKLLSGRWQMVFHQGTLSAEPSQV
ncbi:DUF4440 domain-containing protein [Scytonema sp. NUACC26]|uniref:nuclear transport factor 2 family protein n=1 Tax=Scytonema sp. NUACC26 TaxID=3140176 RepID=UPI0034DC2EFB